VIIDVDGSGYQLTSAAGGVRFDFFGTGHPVRIAWTAPGSTNAFLVLPGGGRVTDGRELFGEPDAAATFTASCDGTVRVEVSPAVNGQPQSVSPSRVLRQTDPHPHLRSASQ
jgi:hypothetical protein